MSFFKSPTVSSELEVLVKGNCGVVEILMQGTNTQYILIRWLKYKLKIDKWNAFTIQICFVYMFTLLNNYWMRSSRIWGIIKAKVCGIYQSQRLRQMTQTKALIIPHILREPNSIIVLLFICICKSFPWRSHLYFEFWHKQHKSFVFCIWHKQHKLVWRLTVVPIEVFLKYWFNTFPQVEELSW